MSKRSLLNEDEYNGDDIIIPKVENNPIVVNVPDNRAVDETAKNKPKYLRLELKGDSHKYLTLITDQTGQSMTAYINMLIDNDKQKNNELYQKLIEIEKIKINAMKNI